MMEPIATRHYFDREFGISAVKVLQGEYFVTSENMVLTTVLGSCVSACVRDSAAGIGGMNHFMLPYEADPPARDVATAMRYGAYAMEVLLKALLKAGARRDRLEAKVFGGGAVLTNMTMLNIGERNAAFVLHYLQEVQVRVLAHDLRGNLPRRINYFPANGRVTMRKLSQQNDAVLVRQDEQRLVQALLERNGRSRVELPETGVLNSGSENKAWAL